jgi:DNA anti-recombination protein RmuC
MERTVWTDERLDDALTRIDRRFDQVDRSFDRVWDEFRELRAELSSSNRQLNAEISSSSRQLAQVGWALVGILIVQLIAAVVALS